MISKPNIFNPVEMPCSRWMTARKNSQVFEPYSPTPHHTHPPLKLSLIGNVIFPKIRMPGGNCRRNCQYSHIINAFQRQGSCDDCNWLWYGFICKRIWNAGVWANWSPKVAGSFQVYLTLTPSPGRDACRVHPVWRQGTHTFRQVSTSTKIWSCAEIKSKSSHRADL